MKNFSKLLAVILCMVLLVASLPMAAFATENSAICQLDTVYHVFVYDDADIVTFNFTPEQSACYSLRSYGFEDAYVDVYDEYYNFVAGDDDGGKEYNFNCNVYLEEGKTYYFEMGAYFAYESVFDFMIINLSDLDAATMDEATRQVASVDSENPSAFYEFTATADGYYAFSSSTDEVDTYMFAYDSEWNPINKNDDGGVDYNGCVNVYLLEGESCYFEATTYIDGEDALFHVYVNKTEVVTDIKIISTPDSAVCYEGFVDETLNLSGLVLELIYSDATTLEFDYDFYPDIDGTSLFFDWNIDEYGDYYLYIMTDFACVEMPFEAIENPVKSISVSDDIAVELYEHTGGFFEGEKFYYVYDIPEDLVIDVEYKDGTTATVDYASGINNIPFGVYDNQANGEYFELGNNTAYIEYFGVVCEINVFVSDMPSYLGDVDCDGDISILDATAIQLHSARKVELTDVQLKLADTDKDGDVSVMDATQIQRLLAKKITEL